jgi:hypothetical protein
MKIPASGIIYRNTKSPEIHIQLEKTSTAKAIWGKNNRTGSSTL